METVKNQDTGAELASCLVHVRGKDIVVAALGKDIAVYKITDKQEIITVTRVPCENNKNLGVVSVYKDSKIVTAGEDGIIRLWNLESDKNIVKILEIDTGTDVTSCDTNEKFICAALKTKFCNIYSSETGIKLKTLQFGEVITNPMMIKSCYFNRTELFTLGTGVKTGSYLTKWNLYPEIFPVDSIKVAECGASYLKVSKTGKKAGIGTSDGTVVVINTSDLSIIYQNNEFDMPATCLEFNSKEKIVLAGSADYAYKYIKISSTSWTKIFILGLFLSIIGYHFFSPNLIS